MNHIHQRALPNAKRASTYEADSIRGLEEIAYQELRQRFGKNIHFLRQAEEESEAGAIHFSYTGPQAALLQLQTVVSVYLVCYFDIPRPAALLGHEHFHQLLEKCKEVCRLGLRERQ